MKNPSNAIIILFFISTLVFPLTLVGEEPQAAGQELEHCGTLEAVHAANAPANDQMKELTPLIGTWQHETLVDGEYRNSGQSLVYWALGGYSIISMGNVDGISGCYLHLVGWNEKTGSIEYVTRTDTGAMESGTWIVTEGGSKIKFTGIRIYADGTLKKREGTINISDNDLAWVLTEGAGDSSVTTKGTSKKTH